MWSTPSDHPLRRLLFALIILDQQAGDSDAERLLSRLKREANLRTGFRFISVPG